MPTHTETISDTITKESEVDTINIFFGYLCGKVCHVAVISTSCRKVLVKTLFELMAIGQDIEEKILKKLVKSPKC